MFAALYSTETITENHICLYNVNKYVHVSMFYLVYIAVCVAVNNYLVMLLS